MNRLVNSWIIDFSQGTDEATMLELDGLDKGLDIRWKACHP